MCLVNPLTFSEASACFVPLLFLLIISPLKTREVWRFTSGLKFACLITVWMCDFEMDYKNVVLL